MQLKSILTTCNNVTSLAKDVSINYERLDEMIASLDFNRSKHWLESNPYGILDNDLDYIIDFLFLYHTIGDFCFWGNPKWSIEADGKTIDGSYAMIYLMLNNMDRFASNNLSYGEFTALVKGTSPLPLAKERYYFLVEARRFLKGEKFSKLIKDKLIDEELFNYIISSLDYFLDEETYNGEKVYFYKRAQLLTSDILHVMKSRGIDVCYDSLVGCADYKIPQALRNRGILEFSESLSDRVDRGITIEKGSKEEIEIRAATISVIDYIAKHYEETVARMDINDAIWLLGQDKLINTKPYHKTLTTKY